MLLANYFWTSNGAEVYYLIFSSGVANRTLSQICVRLYLPTFLFRVELLTERRIKTSRRSPNTMQISQVGYPKDTKRTRTEEEQEEQRRKHQNTEKMSHSGTLYQRTM